MDSGTTFIMSFLLTSIIAVFLLNCLRDIYAHADTLNAFIIGCGLFSFRKLSELYPWSTDATTKIDVINQNNNISINCKLFIGSKVKLTVDNKELIDACNDILDHRPDIDPAEEKIITSANSSIFRDVCAFCTGTASEFQNCDFCRDNYCRIKCQGTLTLFGKDFEIPFNVLFCHECFEYVLKKLNKIIKTNSEYLVALTI